MVSFESVSFIFNTMAIYFLVVQHFMEMKDLV